MANLHYAHATWDAATPYLLRVAAVDVRYSEQESQRIAAVAAGQPDRFFNCVVLDEHNGDRLLVVGYAPVA